MDAREALEYELMDAQKIDAYEMMGAQKTDAYKMTGAELTRAHELKGAQKTDAFEPMGMGAQKTREYELMGRVDKSQKIMRNCKIRAYRTDVSESGRMMELKSFTTTREIARVKMLT